MSILVKNIYIDRPVPSSDGSAQHTMRLTFHFNDEVDFPFIMGKVGDIIPEEILRENQPKGRYKVIEQLFVNEAGLFRSVIKTGDYGWYFIELPKGQIFQDLSVSPDDIDIDLYISKNDKCLLFSFYNAISDKISITGKVIDDRKGVYIKIKSSMDDLQLRNYYLRGCLSGKETKVTDDYNIPNLLGHDEAAKYLRISSKTLYNWVSSEKIMVTKVGGTNKFRKTDLDNWLQSHTRNQQKKAVVRRLRGK